jgi:hypothetical protein
VVLTQMEHHANLVPWQLLHEQAGIEIAVLPVRSRKPASLTSRHRRRCSGALPGCSHWPTSQMRSRPSTRSRTSCTSPTSTGSWCWSTAPKRWRTTAWTGGPWTATSTAFSGHKM